MGGKKKASLAQINLLNGLRGYDPKVPRAEEGMRAEDAAKLIEHLMGLKKAGYPLKEIIENKAIFKPKRGI